MNRIRSCHQYAAICSEGRAHASSDSSVRQIQLLASTQVKLGLMPQRFCPSLALGSLYDSLLRSL